MKEHLAKSREITKNVVLREALNSATIEINGQVLAPDLTKAYVESFQAHAFPVVTVFGTAFYPRVLANSFRSMRHQLLDLHHLIKAYGADTPGDHSLGTVVEVELVNPGQEIKAQPDKSLAPCIRAVSVIHRQLQNAEEVIATQVVGEINWTVSMEHKYYLEDSGFIVAGTSGVERWEESTPQDLRDMGYVYVPYEAAPSGLKACFDEKNTKIVKQFNGQDVVIFLGGISGRLHFMGIGITPVGKEKEAFIRQMLASGVDYVDIGGLLVPKVMAPLAALPRLFANVKRDA